jgi:hypothetical protein
MLNNSLVRSRTVLGVCFTVLIAVTGLASCGGATNTTATGQSGNSGPAAPIILPSSITAAVAKYESMPTRGTVHYFCDCGTGHTAGCVAGKESNDGLSKETPKQLFATAISTLNALTTAGTVALCKGGAFNDQSTNWNSMGQNHCTAGQTCFDLREYTPTTFTGTAKPIVNFHTGQSYVFSFGSTGGYRIMNLRFQSARAGNVALMYPGKDIVWGNNEIDSFTIGLQDVFMNVAPSNITIEGNSFTNNVQMGILASGDNLSINYNYFYHNGSDSSLDHTIYLTSMHGSSNVNVVGNYIEGSSSSDGICKGNMIGAHGSIAGLNITDNTLVQTSTGSAPGCWGIALDDGGYWGEFGLATYFRNAVIARNTLINTGNLAIEVANSPNGLIEDNLIINDAYAMYNIAIVDGPTGTGNDANTAITVRNNTMWNGPNSKSGVVGIKLWPLEGTGYVFANNSINYTASSGGYGVSCFDIGRGFANVSFMNNNHCNVTSSVSSAWEKTHGPTLSDWVKYSGGFDAASILSPPNFKNATSSGYDFTPARDTSPLIGTGDALHGAPNDLTNIKRPPTSIGAFEPLPL